MLLARLRQVVDQRLRIDIDYRDWLVTGETLVAVYCTIDAGSATVDTIVLSPDRKSVSFFLVGGTFQDQFNVIVEADTTLTQARFDHIEVFVATNGGPVLTSNNANLMLSIVGPTGPFGTGPTGAPGSIVGFTGPRGPTGPTGYTGPTGSTGYTGAGGAGSIGPAGATGPTGLQGAASTVTGATGNTGPAGAVASTGATGNTGPTGSTGNTGAAGTNGSNGSAGATGPTGPTGSGGAGGATGNTGPTGTGVVSDINFVIDGGGSAITAGTTGMSGSAGPKGYFPVDFACTINQVELLADQSGSIVVDIYKCTYSNFNPGTHPIQSDSITSAANPTISSTFKAQDSTLTGWNTSITAGDILAFFVKSCTTITRCTVSLKITRN